MTKGFIDFLSTIEGASFRAATDDEIAKLKELSDNRLPNDFIEIYSKSVLENKVEYEDIVFYGIGRMYDENIVYVPGINGKITLLRSEKIYI